ncbi:hypothetical protein BS17DRAFT_782973, partial [Gyrodon lividus]
MVPQLNQSHLGFAYPALPNIQPTALPQSLTTTPSSEGHGLLTPSPFTPALTLTPTDLGIEIRGVKFGDFGPEFDAKGFVQISQLSRDYMLTQVLQDLLRIEMGTTILILQHVEADLQSISSGRSVA